MGQVRDKIPAKNSPFKGAPAVGSVSGSVGAESTDTITVTCTFKDTNGRTLANKAGVKCWLSDRSDGMSLATVPTGGIAINTGVANGLLIEDINNSSFTLVCNATGGAVLDIIDSGTPTLYLAYLDGNNNMGTPIGPITFA